MRISQHPKHKIWTTKPNYIVTFSTDGNIWVSDKHIFKIKARCPEIAIERATELLKCFNDPDAVFVSVKKYYSKKPNRSSKKGRLRELKKNNIDSHLQPFYLLKLPTYKYNFRKINFQELIKSVEPMKNYDGSPVIRYFHDGGK